MLSERLFKPLYHKLHVWFIASLIFGSVLFALPARATVLLSDSPDLEHSQALPAGEMATFELPDNILDTTTITHSASQNIMAGNSVACSSDGGSTTTENGYLRTFVLEEFGIVGDFDIVEVSFGLENLSGVGQSLDVNIFTLDAEPFIYDNMTLIATESIFLNPQSLTIIELPIEATIPAGSTLVVEVDWPNTSGVSGFFIGSNNLGQTAPSYLRSASCGLPQPTNVANIGFPGMHIVMNVTGSVSSPTPTQFAYINQPWDWIDGIANPGSTITGTLKRSGSTIATASTTSDANGIFSFHFLSGGNHLDLLVGDEVTVNGGGLNATLTLIDINGSINTAANQVSGQASGGVFPSSGIAKVGQPADLGFLAETFNFAADGTFLVDFDGVFDINSNHFAKVQYTDPNGNMVVQLINPTGLDVRVLINEGRIEGVTTPGEQVSVLVSDDDGPKASANVVADATGFYSTLVYDRGFKVDLELGDHIEVKNSSVVRSTTLTMHHVSYLQPWNDRIVGQILGVNFPSEGATGRVDLWSVDQQKWYTQYIGVDSEGEYGADFSGIVDMMDADIVRVWVILPDGNMQATLGWGLHLGVSTSDNEVWGYTTAYESVEISLYRGLDGDQPVDLIGTASTTSQPCGYFSATVMSDGKPVDITPSNVLVVQAGEHENTLFIGEVKATVVINQTMINISGAPNSVVHVEGRRSGVIRDDARYQDDYFWREITLDSDGKGSVSLSEFDIQPGDLFDITSYIMDNGLAVHNVTAVPGQPARPIYLPLVIRASG